MTPPTATHPPTTQGTPWTDADYAAHGYARLSLRLPADVLTALDAIRGDDSRTQTLVTLIRRAHKRSQKRLKPNKSTVTPNSPLDV